MALNLDRRKINRKVLLFAAICGALGAIGIFQPLTLGLNVLQSSIKTKPVSSDIVIVGIDSRSIKDIGRWPWPREKQGELLSAIDTYRPKAVYVDIGYQGKTNPASDRSFRLALENMKAPTKVIALTTDKDDGTIESIRSHPSAIGSTKSVTAALLYDFGYVWRIPTSIESDGEILPSLAASANKTVVADESNFRIDYNYDPRSITIVSAKDVLAQTANSAQLTDKTVFLGITDTTQNDIHSMPGWGERAGVTFHVMGAETLKSGLPTDLGWTAFFVVALLLCGLMLTRRGLYLNRYGAWAGNLAILTASTWLTAVHIINDPLPAIALIACSSAYISRQKAALRRSQRNSETGFSDMTGYMADEVVSNAIFIGASLAQAQTVRGFILEADKVKIMREVGRRLSTVVDDHQLTHNGHQQFLWEMAPMNTTVLSEHLEGLRRLFSQPIEINGRKVDFDIFFGVDRNLNRNIKNRMNSALAASQEAKRASSTFKIATANSLEDHLTSNFAQEFTDAIANEDAILMLEAQQILTTGAVNSAEATIRWTHPASGRIETVRLFELAKTSGNLDLLTRILCRDAIKAAGKLIRLNPKFCVRIKVSVSVIMTEDFIDTVLAEAKRAACNPSGIVFDIVDIHSNQQDRNAVRAVDQLKAAGFEIGVGNFGLSTQDIDILTTIKPDQIFLAKSFCAELLGSTSNQIFADAALRLAGARHIESTADGVDDRDILAELKRRGCRQGKGKLISTPLKLQEFIETYLQPQGQKFG